MQDDVEQLGFLPRLMLRLTLGASQLPQEVQDRHARYVLDRQCEDGGWAGREGESDIYYTSFALRTLAILGLLDGKVAERAGDFLRARTEGRETIVDLLSLVYSAKLIEAACSLDPLADLPNTWIEKLAELLELLRRDDGGFSKSFEGQASSTYQTFLVLLCLELIDRPVPDAEKVTEFILRQRQSDGGFLEIRAAKRSGTNPTAAAIGALGILGKLTPQLCADAAEFLLDLQLDEGGLAANTRIPMPDVLSTFTGCVTLADIDALSSLDIAAAQRYVRSMERKSGGFGGFEFDTEEDVEYTFYGLGALALLASE